MEYTVKKLAQLSGVSTRTLRYYDEIGLLKPERISSNGYRIYGQIQIDLLQQILFYRQMGMPLETIRDMITASDFNIASALEDHLTSLKEQQLQIETLIDNVEKSIRAVKGGRSMSDKEKFEGFKKKLIDENEVKYGSEIRQKYGDKAIEESNAKVAGMTPEQWHTQEELSQQIFSLLAEGMKNGDPACDAAQRACDAHRRWLNMFWPEGTYSKEAHRNLGQMYVSDERFKVYYDDSAGPGAAEFLLEALQIYTN